MENVRIYNFKGSTDFVSDENAFVTIRATGEFTIFDAKMNILGPKHSTDREFHLFMHEAESIIIEADDKVRLTLLVEDKPPRGEVVSSESLVEIIPASEMSLEDRLRGEFMAKLNAIAEARDMDTFEDDADYEDDEDFDDTPLTPYEYEVMKEEHLVEDVEPEQAEQTGVSDDSTAASDNTAEDATDDKSEGSAAV